MKEAFVLLAIFLANLYIGTAEAREIRLEKSYVDYNMPPTVLLQQMYAKCQAEALSQDMVVTGLDQVRFTYPNFNETGIEAVCLLNADR